MNPDDGVFETMLARDGRIQALGLHLERLQRSVAELYDERLPGDLAARTREVAAELIEPHRLRIDATPAPDGLHLAISATGVPTGPDPNTPVRLTPVVVPGGIGPHKWRDRRLIESLSDTDTVPLILDEPDELLEAGSMNVWILEGATVITPPADGRLLPGVTRALLLELAPTVDLQASTERITLERARAADAIFVTSSIRHISAAALADGTGPPPPTALAQTLKPPLDALEWV